ncbi:MAG: bifunctional oligoribonuclease/PAP phosphatase NrnA [Thermodesulfobacteriota bacterium]
MDQRVDRVIEEIQRGYRFLVISHVSPEGDAVGSTIGLALALKGLGKDVTPYLEDPVPEVFQFLPGASLVVHTLDSGEGYDAVFAVDCGQKERLGKGFNSLATGTRIINIDHHRTNDRFGDINVIEPDASSTGEMIYDLLRAASIEITKDIAVNLYVAIHTDTGSFRYSATSPAAFRKAADLVALGVDPWEVAQQVYESYPFERCRLLALVLGTLERTNGGEIASMVVTQEMLKSLRVTEELLDGFINYARAIKGVQVAIMIRETGMNRFKVSFRSKGSIDVAAISHNFGGGGHINAAGCNLEGSLESVRERVIEAVEGVIRGEPS